MNQTRDDLLGPVRDIQKIRGKLHMVCPNTPPNLPDYGLFMSHGTNQVVVCYPQSRMI